MMERLTNYYADVSLLEGKDAYGINGDISTDSFKFFDKCTQSTFEACDDTMPPK